METCRLQPCIKLDCQREELVEIINKAKDWALLHGISMRPKKSYNKNQVQILSFTLLPSSFPRKSFEKAKSIQMLLNELTHKVAHDKSFIINSLKSTIQADPFTAKLFNIFEIVHEEGFSQVLSLGLLRSDYMLHKQSGDKIKQIELNTIASSFGGIAPITTQYHKYILSELGHRDKLKNIPENNSIRGLCKGLTHAWTLYNNKRAVILFAVEEVTSNICDQRFHEFEIHNINPEIKVIRRTLKSLALNAKLGPNNELLVENMVVSVVYFRTGYEVEAYPSEQEWSVRLLIERSHAIKCPSIQYHLAGTKKIQQSLARPGALKRFFKDEHKIKQIQEVFAGLYALDFNEEGEEIIEKAMSDPKNYVLKPQREGGGNNVYDDNIKVHLSAIRKSDERSAWILMDRICPPMQANHIIQATDEERPEGSNPYLTDVVCELGVYGVVIGNHDSIVHNEEVGHVLRTKPAFENEGGIVAGFGALDSPYLIN